VEGEAGEHSGVVLVRLDLLLKLVHSVAANLQVVVLVAQILEKGKVTNHKRSSSSY
jgi:hypothetical protein